MTTEEQATCRAGPLGRLALPLLPPAERARWGSFRVTTEEQSEEAYGAEWRCERSQTLARRCGDGWQAVLSVPTYSFERDFDHPARSQVEERPGLGRELFVDRERQILYVEAGSDTLFASRDGGASGKELSEGAQRQLVKERGKRLVRLPLPT
jgi:hypothetical protein